MTNLMRHSFWDLLGEQGERGGSSPSHMSTNKQKHIETPLECVACASDLKAEWEMELQAQREFEL